MADRKTGNLLAKLPDSLPEEHIETLFESAGVRMERIVSTGQTTPPGQWYDQPRAEWVLLLKGAAGLRFEDESETRTLGPGDYVFVAPNARHRIEWTSNREPTVWLALHLADI